MSKFKKNVVRVKKRIKKYYGVIIDLTKTIVAKVFFVKRRTVFEVHPGLRWGNVLYFLLHTYKENMEKGSAVLLYTEAMQEGLECFPMLKDLVIKENDIKFLDKVIYLNDYYQHYGEDFSPSLLKDFIDKYIISTELPEKKDVVICVRRTDYYTEANRILYGFDQISYIKTSLKSVDISRKITVISDDISWCKSNLQFVIDVGYHVTYCDQGPMEDFESLIHSEITIIPNSTFAYWAAYIGRQIYPDKVVYAPNYGTRLLNDGKPISAEPSWYLIDVDIYGK